MIAETEFAFSNAPIACAITGLPAIAMKSLSEPIRRLLPPATMMAVSMVESLHRYIVTSLHRQRFNVLTNHGLSCFCTSWLSVLPSARPPTLACDAFMTAPICAFDVAPISACAGRRAWPHLLRASLLSNRNRDALEKSSLQATATNLHRNHSKLPNESQATAARYLTR